MPNQNQIARARIHFIKNTLDLEKVKIDRVLSGQISGGFFNPEIQASYEAFSKSNFADKLSVEELTQAELTTYDTYFFLNPDRIAGTQTPGTGYMSPIITKGKLADALELLDARVKNQEPRAKSQEPPMPKPSAKIDPQPVQTKLSGDELIILEKALDQKKGDTSTNMTFSESINYYNPSLTQEEIQAWVWYQRKYGQPMLGWEDYFLTSTEQNNNVVVAKVETVLKSPAWVDVKTVPAGTVLGRKNKKELEYRGVTYTFIKNEYGEILVVDSSHIAIDAHSKQAAQSEVDALVNAGVLFMLDGELVPEAIFTYGNIYTKLDDVRKNEDEIVLTYSKEVFENHLKVLNKAKPTQLKFDDAQKDKRPILLSLGSYASNITKIGLEELKPEVGFELRLNNDEPVSLVEAFEQWLTNFVPDKDIKDTTKSDIINHYIGDKNFPKDMDRIEKEEKKLRAKVECERLFAEFLATALLPDDLFKLNELWNREFNAIARVNAAKVPVSFIASKTFKNKPYSLKPVQRNGLSFLSVVGSGCLAYDVGYGKTMTAIANAAMVLTTGRAKRCIIAVPNPTYKNWKKELFGYWSDGSKTEFTEFKGATFYTGILSGTDINFYDWQNLGVDIFKKQGIKNEQIKEQSIVLVTHEGLSNISYSDSLMKSFFNELRAILEQDDSKSARDQEKEDTKILELIGASKAETKLDIDVLGIDHITVDEAHNFKNVFPRVGKDPDSGRALFGITSGQSARAIKLFFLTNYIQRKYNKNVVFLTATPFTNSPLEIYSMMAMIGLDSLEKYGVKNIRTFFETFIQETIEYKVNGKNDVVVDSVIKGYANKLLLQKILYNHFDYRADPKEAKIVRPCKVVLPLTKTYDRAIQVPLPLEDQITTYLDQSDMQASVQQTVLDMANSISKDNPGAMIKALNMSKSNSFSPHFAMEVKVAELTAEEFVNESPKIKYAIECIRTIKQYHEDRNEEISGSVIYATRGVDYLPLIKEYLDIHLGYKKNMSYSKSSIDEVEIISGSTTPQRKELLKEAFLDGTVKVLIGTSTIKEGVNLQIKGTSIFNLTPDWNPSDGKQLEGRIYRQGNEYGFVRIITPMVQNSLDPFIYQKYEEKSARIGSLWNQDGSNMMEEDGVDPNEIKFALISNPQTLFKMIFDEELKKKELNERIALENLQTINDVHKYIYEYNEAKEYWHKWCIDRDALWGRYINDLKEVVDYYKTQEFDNSKEIVKKGTNLITKIQNQLKELQSFNTSQKDDADLFALLKSISVKKWNEDHYSLSTKFRSNDFYIDFTKRGNLRESKGRIAKIEKEILQPRKMTIHSGLTDLIEELTVELSKAEKDLEELQSEESKNTIKNKVIAELDRRASLRGDLWSQVDKFASLNHLLSYKTDNVDKDACIIPKVECCPHNPSAKKAPRIVVEEEAIESEGFKEPMSSIKSEKVDNSIQDAIDALGILLDLQDSAAEKEKLQDAIEALELIM